MGRPQGACKQSLRQFFANSTRSLAAKVVMEPRRRAKVVLANVSNVARFQTMQERNPKSLPPQQQYHQPGDESEMIPRPDFMPRQAGSGRLKGKIALITGGDSGIGRAVSVLFAREGAQIAIVYLEEDDDAKETEALVRHEGTDC